MRSGKKSEPACEVFAIQLKLTSSKQHERIENRAPLRTRAVDGIEERPRSEEVLCKY